MRAPRTLSLVALAAVAATLVGALAAGAGAVTVRFGKLVLKADGGLTPRVLPRRAFAPIRFQGHADIKTVDGSMPPALRRVRLEFDRDGRLATAGLPVCRPAQLRDATPGQARRRCRRALVGSGHVGAEIALPGQARVKVRAPLSLFNGPRKGRNPTVLAHTRNTFPAPEVFVIEVPIERRQGYFRYRATAELPEIAGGHGSLTHVDARVGRRYRAGGRKRSYVSARCSDGILETFGFLSFSDGTVLSGTLFEPCRARH